ncbi:hypothetical protein [Cupriavidus sp. CP313]
MGRLADSHLRILPLGSGTSRGLTLELVASLNAGCSVAPTLLEMPHVQAHVPFDVYWTTIQGFLPDSLLSGHIAPMELS